MAAVKVPDSMKRLAEQAPADMRGGTVAWRARMDPARQAQFDASLRLLGEARAKGRRISYKAMVEALRAEFDYPFTAGALRGYMETRAAPRPGRAAKSRGKALGKARG